MVRFIPGCLAAFFITAVAVPGEAVANPTSASAQASAPLRALVLLLPETDDVLSRIRGQTSDLRVELLIEAIYSMPADVGAQLRMAYTRSHQRDASVVMWFVESPSPDRHFIVNIAIPEQSRLLTRDLGPSDAAPVGSGPASAVKESAALVVRAAIQAVLGGSTIGDVEQVPVDDAAQTQASAQPSANAAPSGPPGANPRAWRDTTNAPKEKPRGSNATPETPPAPALTSASRDRSWAFGVSWLTLYDSAPGHALAEAVSLRVERQIHRFQAFVDASLGPEREIDAGSYGRFRIARQHVALGASVSVLQTWFDVSVGAHLGAVIYERSTDRAPGATSPTTHLMGAAGPELRLLAPTHGSPIQGGLALGMDFVTDSLRIGYNDPAAPAPSHFVQIAKISMVQPYVALGLGARW